MASKVQICNLALVRVRGDRITSLTDNTVNAKLCNILIDDIIDEVLVEGPWPVAVTRKTINATTNTPAFEYDYEFQLPTNPYCLKVLSVNEDKPGQLQWNIEGDKLLANDSSIIIKYIGRITDTQAFDPALTRAIVSRLAAELAYPLTGNATFVNMLLNLYQSDLEKGLSNMTQQGSPDKLHSDDLDDVR